jgi:PAS domain-containing protein
MTERQALHLIEQFAAQAPFAVWITDSRGVAIFANKRIHELFDIPLHPSGAVGMNLFEEPGIAQLGLQKTAERARSGEVVDVVIEIPDPKSVRTTLPAERKAPLTIKVTCYALRSSTQKIEHYVIFIDDVTETYAQREKLRRQLQDIAVLVKSKAARLDKVRELETENARLEEEIRKLGASPMI